MADFSSNDEFYEFVDRFAARLADAGREAHARKLRTLFHEVAWTTSSEFLGELGREFRNLEATAQELPVSGHSFLIRQLSGDERMRKLRSWSVRDPS